ncbi:MAG: DsbE family thiol:disulfide interchange protein [Rhodospirillales bacterium]|nr:DsbE family thiol:disulfide interchange protein [Rhodospirillales bacterium]MDH3791176.1 DsbE family thiol:disulfide interchange protein [Rhodospirillales bacterium]MDH3969080.1 DsbE family thiol:disulfide interchange protein [Rhodospirillales bacterium]
MSEASDMETPSLEAPSKPGRRLPLGFIVPVALFVALAGLFAIGLGMDPGRVPSVLIGKPVPDFDLPPVEGRRLGLARSDLVGEVSLVNVFASWCAECRREHPLLMDINARGLVPVHGLNYKDTPEDAKGWLDGLGDPYTRTGADIDGRVAIDFGVYGVPETFVIDKAGRIAHKHIGAIDGRALQETILPLVEALRAAP